MRLRIWGRLAAAVLGAAALAGSASAQAPAPAFVPQQVVAQPAPGPTAPTVAIPGAPATLPPAAAASVPVAPAPGTTVVNGGTSHRGFVMNATGGYLGTSCGLGQPCNNGCGSLRSDLGLVFGSCRSFFAPCGPKAFGHGGCNRPVLGSGPCGPFNPCVYDSYLNH
ncbi:MAG TPA: hypothetical protein VD866_12025 [Urbifossiella sp.]|nr:hypothetical protein [Urbifossiella sp.]